MRSVYIIMGGILAMIAVVFLTQNSKNDATDSVQQAETNSQETPNERWRHPEVVALEKTEMRKYGRILTPDERSEQWWREQDEAEERAASTKLYEEQKDWIDNFPFRRGYHPDIVFDPENNIAHSDEKFYAYQKKLEKKSGELWHSIPDREAEIWARTDLTREEKEKASDQLRLDVEEARNPDPEIMAERLVIMRHKRLDGFYKQHYRYLPEFEQAYRIFEEEGLADNPIRLAHTMVGLENYFVTQRQAKQHGLDELHPVQTRTYTPTGNHNLHTNRIIGYFHNSQSRRPDSRPKRQRITWGELMEEDFHIVRNCVRSEWVAAPGEERPSVKLAERIRDRLIAEIPPDGFTGQTFLFGLRDPEDDEMRAGQSLLVE